MAVAKGDVRDVITSGKIFIGSSSYYRPSMNILAATPILSSFFQLNIIEISFSIFCIFIYYLYFGMHILYACVTAIVLSLCTKFVNKEEIVSGTRSKGFGDY